MSRDRELEIGASAHYDDPAYYTSVYVRRQDDIRYYVRCAQSRGATVLEYGCGNGRIAIPMAQAGNDVVGVDLSASMLADFRRRIRSLAPNVADRIALHHGDMRSVRLQRRFSLVICPFNAFLHLYDRRSVERFLARVREHLTARGTRPRRFDARPTRPRPFALASVRCTVLPVSRQPKRTARVAWPKGSLLGAVRLRLSAPDTFRHDGVCA